MNDRVFVAFLIFAICTFSIFFFVYFVPPIIQDPDIVGVLQAGFVNPYAAGYSIDLIACWLVLIVFVVFEARSKSIRYGWICILLGLAPGVVVGWSAYLLLRHRQLGNGAGKNA